VRSRKSGLSIFEILIALGILGLAGTLVTSMMSDYTNEKMINDATHLVKNFGFELSRAMADPSVCMKTMVAGNLTNLDLSAEPTLRAIKGGSGGNIYIVGGRYFDKKVKIESMQIVDFVPATAPSDVGGFTLRFKLKILDNTKLERVMTYDYKSNIKVDGSNHIKSPPSCYASVLDAFVNKAPINPEDDMLGSLVVNISPPSADTRAIFVEGGYLETDNFYLDSDRRLKRNIRTIEKPLEKNNFLRGRRFVWKSTQQPDWGFISQEVSSHFPKLVTRPEMGGPQAVKYLSVLPLQVEAIKELHRNQIESKKELARLRKQIRRLKGKSYAED
jgi:hypothetical protein